MKEETSVKQDSEDNNKKKLTWKSVYFFFRHRSKNAQTNFQVKNIIPEKTIFNIFINILMNEWLTFNYYKASYGIFLLKAEEISFRRHYVKGYYYFNHRKYLY